MVPTRDQIEALRTALLDEGHPPISQVELEDMASEMLVDEMRTGRAIGVRSIREIATDHARERVRTAHETPRSR